MPIVEANGIRINLIRIAPENPVSPPVVLLHGIVIDNLSSVYYTLANHVAATNVAIACDLRGHGRSDRPPAGYRIADFVADLDGMLDAMGIDEPVVMVGNSFGGTIALGFAIAHPERTAGLVLIEAHYGVEGWGDEMATMLHLCARFAREGMAIEEDFRETRKLAPDALPTLKEMALDEEGMAGVRHWIETTSMRKALTMARTAVALVDGTTMVSDVQGEAILGEDDFRAVTCPVLLLYGSDSDIVDRARRLHKLLPTSELAILEGHTHMILMSGPEELRARLLPWLAKLSAKPST